MIVISTVLVNITNRSVFDRMTIVQLFGKGFSYMREGVLMGG
jgi:hypothetical protein